MRLAKGLGACTLCTLANALTKPSDRRHVSAFIYTTDRAPANIYANAHARNHNAPIA